MKLAIPASLFLVMSASLVAMALASCEGSMQDTNMLLQTHKNVPTPEGGHRGWRRFSRQRRRHRRRQRREAPHYGPGTTTLSSTGTSTSTSTSTSTTTSIVSCPRLPPDFDIEIPSGLGVLPNVTVGYPLVTFAFTVEADSATSPPDFDLTNCCSSRFLQFRLELEQSQPVLDADQSDFGIVLTKGGTSLVPVLIVVSTVRNRVIFRFEDVEEVRLIGLWRVSLTYPSTWEGQEVRDADLRAYKDRTTSCST